MYIYARKATRCYQYDGGFFLYLLLVLKARKALSGSPIVLQLQIKYSPYFGGCITQGDSCGCMATVAEKIVTICPMDSLLYFHYINKDTPLQGIKCGG